MNILIILGIIIGIVFIFFTLCVLKASSKADEYSERIAIQRKIATAAKTHSNK